MAGHARDRPAPATLATPRVQWRAAVLLPVEAAETAIWLTEVAPQSARGKHGQLGGSIRCVVCLRSANRSDRELHAGSRDPIRPRRQRARNPPTRTSLGGALHSNSRLSASMYSVAGASFTMAMICPASAGDQLVQPLLRPLAYSSSCPNGTYPSRSA
jgi:hypothetical protein